MRAIQRLKKLRHNGLMLMAVIGVVVFGGFMLVVSRAISPVVMLEPEAGAITTPAARVADTGASGGSSVRFNRPAFGNSTEPNLKVAFVGDTMINSTGSKTMLQLVKTEGAQLLVHLGDIDYTNNPAAWDAQSNNILGSTFPQIGVLGNHEDTNLAGYRSAIASRLQRSPGVVCTGSPGLQMDCYYKGLHIVGVSPGIRGTGTGHDAYLRSRLAASTSTWNICAWHVNQSALQVGDKTNEAGWGVYEECRMGGGMPMTGHEHSYSRTKTLTNMTTQTVDPACSSPNNVCVARGKTFSTVSGLGGNNGIDRQLRCLPTTYPYGCKGEWARIYSGSQGATYSALFITFNIDGNPNKARGYLKNIAGQVVDNFEITRQ